VVGDIPVPLSVSMVSLSCANTRCTTRTGFSSSPWIAADSDSLVPVSRLSFVPRATMTGMCTGSPPLSSPTRR
jgi:hypothetical protein